MAGECAFNKCHELGKVPQTAWGETAGVWVKDELHIQSVSCFSDQSSVRCMNVSCVCRLFETNLLFCFYVLMEIRICGLLQIAVTLRADKIHCLFCVSRSGRSSVGLPGRGVRSTSQHRALQQPPLRQEPQQSRLPACGQLSAKCSGPTSGPARGLPNELRPLAGEGSLLQTYFLGRTATVRLDHRQHSCRLFLFFLFFKQFQSGVQMKHHQCSHWSTELFSEQNSMLHILYRLKVTDGFYSQFPAWRSVVGGPAKCFWCLNFCLLRNFALLWFLCSF